MSEEEEPTFVYHTNEVMRRLLENFTTALPQISTSLLLARECSSSPIHPTTLVLIMARSAIMPEEEYHQMMEDILIRVMKRLTMMLISSSFITHKIWQKCGLAWRRSGSFTSGLTGITRRISDTQPKRDERQQNHPVAGERRARVLRSSSCATLPKPNR